MFDIRPFDPEVGHPAHPAAFIEAEDAGFGEPVYQLGKLPAGDGEVYKVSLRGRSEGHAGYFGEARSGELGVLVVVLLLVFYVPGSPAEPTCPPSVRIPTPLLAERGFKLERVPLDSR